MSLTDADARLMKSKNGFVVSHNPQTVGDSETHLIRDFQMTNQVTDHGLLDSRLEGVREETKGIIETVADKGYESEEAGDINGKSVDAGSEWKGIDFTKDCLEKPCRDWLKAEGRELDSEGVNKGKYHFEIKKVVGFF